MRRDLTAADGATAAVKRPPAASCSFRPSVTTVVFPNRFRIADLRGESTPSLSTSTSDCGEAAVKLLPVRDFLLLLLSRRSTRTTAIYVVSAPSPSHNTGSIIPQMDDVAQFRVGISRRKRKAAIQSLMIPDPSDRNLPGGASPPQSQFAIKGAPVRHHASVLINI
jgi:hypothetical protein